MNTASTWVRLSRQWRLTDEEFLALPSYQTSPLFSELDKLVLDYAVGMSRTPVDVSDVLLFALLVGIAPSTTACFSGWLCSESEAVRR